MAFSSRVAMAKAVLLMHILQPGRMSKEGTRDRGRGARRWLKEGFFVGLKMVPDPNERGLPLPSVPTLQIRIRGGSVAED